MLQRIKNGRENLMSIGKKMLLDNGYSGVSISELTKLSGMGTSTFYNYFRSKDDLIYKIVSEDWNVLLKKVDNMPFPPGNDYENLKYLFNLLAEFQRSYNFFESGLAAKNEAVNRSINANLQKLYNLLANIFRKDEMSGVYNVETAPEIMAYMVVQTCMIASRNPDMSYDDLWGFLHVVEYADKQNEKM